MLRRRTLIAVAGVATSLAGFVGIIIFLSAKEMVSAATAILMLVALFGLYLGFGVLVAAYRLVVRLDGARYQHRSRPDPRESGDA